MNGVCLRLGMVLAWLVILGVAALCLWCAWS
jgi:hypothetical protein